jgi:tryptophan-rich sensory protein
MNSTDIVALVLSYVFVHLEFSRLTQEEYKAIFLPRQSLLTFEPAPWVFGLIWGINYWLITLASFFAYYSGSVLTSGSNLYVGIFVTGFVFVLMLKYWSMVFFDLQKFGTGIPIILLAIAAGIVLIILLVIANVWISLGLIVFPVGFLGMALIWNIQFVSGEKPMTLPTSATQNNTQFGRGLKTTPKFPGVVPKAPLKNI